MADVLTTRSDTAIETFVRILRTKRTQDDTSGTIKEEHLQQMAGRITRSSNEADFRYLQRDIKAKKFAWVMGGDGLILFLKQSNIEALRSIGFEDRWIRKKLEDGERFRLGIFCRSDECVLGT